MSNNTALTNLRCHNNQITSLDVSNNTALRYLYCQSNLLTTNVIDNIFSDLAAGSVSNGNLTIDADRSIPGSNADKATLVGRGWTIIEL